MFMLIYLAVFFTESIFSLDCYYLVFITSQFQLGSNSAGHDIALGLDAFFSRDEKIILKREIMGD